LKFSDDLIYFGLGFPAFRFPIKYMLSILTLSAMPTDLQAINRLLPQTQCRECGYQGCLPYAQALLHEDAPVNLCAPGGEAVMGGIASLICKSRHGPAKHHPPHLPQP